MRNTIAIIVTLFAATLVSQHAEATSPPCDYVVGSESVDYSGSATCLEVTVSTCYLGLAATVVNQCQESIELIDWPLYDGEPNVLGHGDFARVNLSDGEEPIDVMLDVVASVEDTGVVHIQAVPESRPYQPINDSYQRGSDDDESGCSVTGGRKPTRGGALFGVILLASVLTVTKRRRCR